MKTFKYSDFVRWAFTLFLIIMSYFETGIFTCIIFILIALKIEIETIQDRKFTIDTSLFGLDDDKIEIHKK